MTGEEFSKLRAKSGLTQARVAELIGKSLNTVQRYEKVVEVPLKAALIMRHLAKPEVAAAIALGQPVPAIGSNGKTKRTVNMQATWPGLRKRLEVDACDLSAREVERSLTPGALFYMWFSPAYAAECDRDNVAKGGSANTALRYPATHWHLFRMLDRGGQERVAPPLAVEGHLGVPRSEPVGKPLTVPYDPVIHSIDDE